MSKGGVTADVTKQVFLGTVGERRRDGGGGDVCGRRQIIITSYW